MNEQYGREPENKNEPKIIMRLVDVSKIYGGTVPFKALDGVSIDIRKGELISIVGRSGSGKSTLLNLLGCLDKPTMGEVYIKGNAISKMSDDRIADLRRDELGFVFQSFNLAPTLNAKDNVELPMAIKGLAKKEREIAALKTLESVGLADKAENFPSQLSGGEKQRVAIARAISNKPCILLADEPTGNLDTKSSRAIIENLEALCRDNGITVIIVTHDQALAEEADRVIRITDGRIESDVKRKNLKKVKK
ncbi:ABC transporter ATP-binding protein [Candidatus Micrarchaeota archaeon]|nr:ABC transporter ATP-binding protein [Candidatus Micrarchaeota archaeon]